jgi:hypothetical protein
MVARDDLVQRARVRVFLEHDEMVQQIEEPLPLEHPTHQHLQRRLRCVAILYFAPFVFSFSNCFFHEAGGFRHMPSGLTNAHFPGIEWIAQMSGLVCLHPSV